jgi:tetratricopeptide (TPR) repeat protein
MPLAESLMALKAVVGITGVAISLYKKGLTSSGEIDNDKTLEAIFGQFVGGVFYDLTKGGASATYEYFKSKYAKIDLSKDKLNHDLQKAARKAQLVATFFATQYCLEETKAENAQVSPDEEKSLVGRTIDRAKDITNKAKRVAFKNSRETYLKEVIEYLNKEIKTPENAVVETLSFDDFLKIFDVYKQAITQDSQMEISTFLKADILAELEWLHKLNPNFIFDRDAFDLLKTTVENGWEELPLERRSSEHFITLNVANLKQSPTGKKYDWFYLVCSIFNEEYKDDPRVKAAANKSLLLTISAKLETFGTLETELSKLVEQISNFAEKVLESIENLKHGQAEIKETQVGIKDELHSINKNLEKFVKPQYYGEPQAFVTLPYLDDKVYGRNDEIKYIFEFLREEKKHGAIVAPSCFGKTYLIKKFLYKTKEAEKVKDEFSDLFEKIIYLDCRQNQTFIEIVKHFATLIGETLKYNEGKEVNFLKLDVFSQIQADKILLIFDNFETWIDKDECYANKEIAIFVNTFFNTNHRIRALFVTQKLPNSERSFSKKVKTLDNIGNKLLKGLSQKTALELVRKEGKEIGLDKVPEKDLIVFLEKVYYVPQAIQSMIGYIDDEAISFSRFQREFWAEFEEEESDETDLEDRLDEPLRPTRALVKRQVLAQDDYTKDILSRLAFLDTPVPEQTLTIDLSNLSSASVEFPTYRKSINKLKKHFLVQTETDSVNEINNETGEEIDIIYYFLHPLIREIVRKVLIKFEVGHVNSFEGFADYLDGEGDKALEAKLYRKLAAISECQLKIEEYLIYTLNRSGRLNSMSRALMGKAFVLSTSDEGSLEGSKSVDVRMNFLKAEEIYRKAIELNPKYANAYFNIGWLLAKDKNRWQEAEGMFRKAIELNSKDADIYINLGYLFAEENRQQEAEEMFRKAIELNSKDAGVYHYLGYFLSEENRQQEAEEMYRKSIELGSKDTDTYVNLGYLLSSKTNFLLSSENRQQEAEEMFRKAIELNPKDVGGHYGLGILLSRQNKINEAVEAFQNAVELDKKDVSLHVSLASMYKKLGEKETSKKYVDEALSLIKEDNYYELTCLHSILENKDEALKYLKLAVEEKPSFTSWAKSDPDLEWIRDDDRFWTIVGREDK